MMQIIGVLIAAASAIAALYTLARPHWAFVLLMVMFPLKQLLQVYVPYIAGHPTYVNIAIGLVVLAATITRYARREQIASCYLNRATILILALYALWLVGIGYSPARQIYINHLPTDLTYIGLLLVFMPLLVLDIFEFRRALFGFMIVGGIICSLVLINPQAIYSSGRLVLDLGGVGSAKDAGNALATASLGAMTALVAALIRPAGVGFHINLLRIGAFVAGMGMAIASGSRGQVLAASIVGVIFFPLSRKLANPKQFMIVIMGFAFLVGGLLAVFNLFIGGQNQERWNPIGMLESAVGRFDMVSNLFSHYLASPVHWMFGLGTGFYAAISIDRSVQRDYVHNMAAEVLCEHGIVGAVLLIWTMILLLKYGRQLWSLYSDDPVMRSTVALLGAIGMYTLLESLKQGSMYYPAPFYWWIILAKLSQHEQKVTAEEKQHAVEEAEPDEFAPVEYDGPLPTPGYAVGS